MTVHLKFAIGFIFILISSCTDEDPCPRCFEDIVTCKVNGKEWRSHCISNDPLFGCRAVDCHYYFTEGNGLDMSAVNSNDHSSIILDQGSAWGGGQLGNHSIELHELGFYDLKQKGNCLLLDSLDTFYKHYFILDKIDTTNYILEGRFGFKVYNHCGDTATITDGHFKTKFIY